MPIMVFPRVLRVACKFVAYGVVYTSLMDKFRNGIAASTQFPSSPFQTTTSSATPTSPPTVIVPTTTNTLIQTTTSLPKPPPIVSSPIHLTIPSHSGEPSIPFYSYASRHGHTLHLSSSTHAISSITQSSTTTTSSSFSPTASQETTQGSINATHHHLSNVALIAIVSVSIVSVLAVSFIVVFIRWRRRFRRSEDEDEDVDIEAKAGQRGSFDQFFGVRRRSMKEGGRGRASVNYWLGKLIDRLTESRSDSQVHAIHRNNSTSKASYSDAHTHNRGDGGPSPSYRERTSLRVHVQDDPERPVLDLHRIFEERAYEPELLAFISEIMDHPEADNTDRERDDGLPSYPGVQQ